MTNYVLLIYVDVITYTCPNRDSSLAYLGYKSTDWYFFATIAAPVFFYTAKF